MENLKALFDITKLPVKFFLLFTVISGLILFANDEIVKSIELSNMKAKYGWSIGFVFIFSLSLVIVNLIIWPYTYLENQWAIKNLKKEFSEMLKSLDSKEKSVLREFFITGQSAIEMPVAHPTIKDLVDNRILEINIPLQESTLTNKGKTTVSINKHAKKILELGDIGLTLNPTAEEIKIIENSRPDWSLK